MIATFDPDRYPGPRPAGPVLVHRGQVHPVAVDGPPGASVRLLERADTHAGGDPAVLAHPADVRWSVAYGSNASPGRLVAKGLDTDGALLLPARMAGMAPAFEDRRTGYGSVPLTLVPSEEAVIDTWVLGLPASAMPLLDRTEGRMPDGAPRQPEPETGDGRFAPPGTYQLAEVGEVAVADRFVLPRGLAYLPGPSTRVQVVGDGAWRTWPSWDQSAAAGHVDRGGPGRPAPPVGRPVLGAWPITPLVDLPLFVYGTLAPGASAWAAIAGLVDVVGPGTTSGVLYDTGRGWPAAVFTSDGDGIVHGTLLEAKGPADADTLVRWTDGYEGVPHPFRRTMVPVSMGMATRWAMAYAWHEDPDGVADLSRIVDGKWVVR